MRLPALPGASYPPPLAFACPALSLPADEGRAAKGSKKEKPMYLKDVMFKQALEGDISSGGWLGWMDGRARWWLWVRRAGMGWCWVL
jgi:hypothetical protein